MNARSFDLLTSRLEGTSLIEASAGTGKTYTLAGLTLRLLVEKELPIERILVVTFTVAATEELRSRVRARIREALSALSRVSEDRFLKALAERSDPARAQALLEAALRGFDQAPIFTIHGFCQRVLRENAFEGGLLFDGELLTDQQSLFQEVVDDYWRKRVCGGPPLLATFALKRGFGPAALLGLLKSHARHPFLEVLPAWGAEETAGRLRNFGEAFEEVCREWPAARPEVEGILREHPGLSRSQKNFRDDAVEACLSALDRCAAGSAPPESFGALRKVAAGSFLEKGVMKKGHAAPEHDFFSLCQALAEAEDELFLALRVDFLRSAREELNRKKELRNVQGFDDLLTRLRDALRAEGGPSLARALRAKYGAALIDEFQDTDPLQYEIFDTVFGTRAAEPSLLFLIGDPKQAIYGFRGADVFAYLEASHRASARYTLSENWRSEPELLDAVAAIFQGRETPFVFPEIRFPEVRAAEKSGRPVLRAGGKAEPPFRVWLARREEGNTSKDRITKRWAERTLPAAVAAEVSRLLSPGGPRLGDRPLEPGDIAVLTRTNRQAALVQGSLRTLRIPSVLYSTQSLFATREAREVERVLLALAEPGNEAPVRAAVTTDLLGTSGEELHALHEDEPSWEAWLARFRDFHEQWADAGFLPMFRRFLSGLGAAERLLAFEDGERRLTNVLHLAEVLHQAATEAKLGPAGLVRWLAARRAGGEGAEEHELRLESDEKAVKLVTVHRSKGLEYPVVFCPFSWEGSELRGTEPALKVHLPGADGGARFVLDLGSDSREEHARRAEVEALAENIRLLYVALTRAKNRCYLTWGAFNTAETSALAYLVPNRARELGAGGLSALEERVRPLGDAALEAAFAGLGDPARLSVEPIPAGLGAAYAPKSTEAFEPRARVFGGTITGGWRTASFSSLVSGAASGEHEADRDAGVESESASGPLEPGAQPLGIHAFPAGAGAGTCLHEILEEWDFARETAADPRGLVAEKLRGHGFSPEWEDAVAAMAGDLARAPLDPAQPELVLGRIARRDRLAEVEFTLPLRQRGEALSPANLAAAFRRFGGEELGAAAGFGVPERLGRLEFSPLRGYLRGFMDLVFRWEGRYYLADWKSNRLGEEPAAYARAALAEAMRRGHYVLQYHLYAVALHLHLAARLPGYDPEQHFGGVFYVFLRGIDPARAGHGVFRDRLSPARLEGLAGYLSGGLA